jgi:hypothetical protein
VQWNVTLQQALGNKQSLSVAYVAAVGRRLLKQGEAFLPNPNVNFVEVIRNGGTSDYHSLQVQYQRRLSQGLQALVSYTWAHSIDTASSGSAGQASNFFVGSLDPSLNRGPSDFDIRHTFSAGLTYAIPSSRMQQRAIRTILSDWSVDSVIQARSAPAVTAIDSNLSFGAGLGFNPAAVRLDVVPGERLYLFGSQCTSLPGEQCPGGKALNPYAFRDPPTDPNTGLALRQGDLGRNALRGFGAVQWDFALHREFHLHESWRLQFRVELFNFLNHPNFSNPVSDLSNPDFGTSISMLSRGLSENSFGDGSFSSIFQLGGPRSVQFGLKLLF